MTFATGADLAAWGVTDDQALRTASANLAQAHARLAADIGDAIGGVFGWPRRASTARSQGQ